MNFDRKIIKPDIKMMKSW